MPPSYRTIAAPAEDEFIEKKSRFIGYIAPVTTEQEAAAFIESVRARHREARHNCYAYRLRQNNLARFSDDGEPSGTAGRPILEVLQREDLTDVARYEMLRERLRGMLNGELTRPFIGRVVFGSIRIQ